MFKSLTLGLFGDMVFRGLYVTGVLIRIGTDARGMCVQRDGPCQEVARGGSPSQREASGDTGLVDICRHRNFRRLASRTVRK